MEGQWGLPSRWINLPRGSGSSQQLSIALVHLAWRRPDQSMKSSIAKQEISWDLKPGTTLCIHLWCPVKRWPGILAQCVHTSLVNWLTHQKVLLHPSPSCFISCGTGPRAKAKAMLDFECAWRTFISDSTSRVGALGPRQVEKPQVAHGSRLALQHAWTPIRHYYL